MGANTVQAAPYNLTGDGVVVGVWDGGCADADHNDLEGRVKVGNCVGIGEHATHVAGTIIGDGSINFNYRGVAPDANAVMYEVWTDVEQAESDYNEAIKDYDIDLSNNSWGYFYRCIAGDTPGTYDGIAAVEDKITLGAFGKRISLVFGAGNDGITPAFGCPTPWRTLRRNAVAKNVISVGATNTDDDSLAPFSSRGPTADGRIKPDLVAPGCDGCGGAECNNSCVDGYGYYYENPPPPVLPIERVSSNWIWSTWPTESPHQHFPYDGMAGTSCAAPVVSGCIALMLERWRNNYNDPNYLPPPSTIKGVLIQTAKDLVDEPNDGPCRTGPDYSSGYGLVDVKAAVDLINADANDETIIIEDSILDTNDSDVFEVNVPADQNELRITLVWDDYPGEPGADEAWVNDLEDRKSVV